MHADENAARIAVIGNRSAQQHEEKRRQHQRHLRNADACRRLIQNLRYEKGEDDELDAKADEPACLTAQIIIEPYPARSRKLRSLMRLRHETGLPFMFLFVILSQTREFKPRRGASSRHGCGYALPCRARGRVLRRAWPRPPPHPG